MTSLGLQLRSLLLGAAVALSSTVALADPQASTSSEVIPEKFRKNTEKVDIVQKPGSRIPQDLEFIDNEGKTVTLSQYLNTGRPVVLQMGYFRCPQICDVISRSLMNSVQKVDLHIGKDYDVLYVSIDPKEDFTLAKEKKAAFVQEYGRESSINGWNFLVGKQDQIDKLADAIGFKYQYVEQQNQFAHPTMLTIITPQGVVSRYLFGVDYSSKTLRMSLVEAGQGKTGDVIDQLVMLCYHFDEYSGKYTLYWMNIMRLGGGLTVVILAIVLTWAFIRDARGYRRTLKTT